MNPSDLEHWLAARPPALAEVIRQLAAACAEISRAAARSGLDPAAGDGVVQGLAQRAEQCVAHALGDCKQVAGFVTDDQREPVISPEHGSGGAYLVLANPLEGEGAGALAGDGPLGTLFSVLPHLFRGTPASPAAFMQPGRRQVAAGYAIYGPRTVLVLSTREGVQMFTLEPGSDRWLLTQDAVAVPATGTAVAVDPANQRFWEKPVQRYVAECVAGQSGPRGRDFTMRWSESLVADVHGIFARGGVLLDPRDNREPYRPGRLRLMFEAAPLALLMEQAGGAAANGSAALLDLVPDALQQRVCVILGSREEVERIVCYHADPSQNVSWQLFKTRSLFIQPQA